MSTLVASGGVAATALLLIVFSAPAALYGSSASQRAVAMRVLTASATVALVSGTLFLQLL